MSGGDSPFGYSITFLARFCIYFFLIAGRTSREKNETSGLEVPNADPDLINSWLAHQEEAYDVRPRVQAEGGARCS